jgi:hypothetical protein
MNLEALFDTILTAMLVGLAAQLIWQVISLYFTYRELDQLVETRISQEIERIFIPCTVEQHGDVLYLFREDNQEFVVQGRTREEIISALRARFGEERRLVVNCDDETICAKLGMQDEDEEEVEIKI